jgi:hypothetical protein
MQSFNEAEARELTAFYRTPLGRKASHEMPLLLQRGAEVGSARVQEHMPELLGLLGAAKGGGAAQPGSPAAPGSGASQVHPNPAKSAPMTSAPPAALH